METTITEIHPGVQYVTKCELICPPFHKSMIFVSLYSFGSLAF